MAKFFINFRNVDKIAEDDLGVDLPSLKDAQKLALLSLRELLAENIQADSKTPVQAAIITDESGLELMTISARDVLPELLK